MSIFGNFDSEMEFTRFVNKGCPQDKRSIFYIRAHFTKELKNLSDSAIANKLKRLLTIRIKLDNLVKGDLCVFSRKWNKTYNQQKEAIIQRHLRTDKLLYSNRKWLKFSETF